MPNEFLPKDSTDLSFEAFVVVEIIYAGAADPGGHGPSLKLKIYLVSFLEKDKFSFFFLLGPPLEKNRSSAPEYMVYDLVVALNRSFSNPKMLFKIINF